MRWTEVTNALRRLEEDQDTLQSDLHERELQRTPRSAVVAAVVQRGFNSPRPPRRDQISI